MNFEIGGAGSELSKHWRHRDECLFIRHRYLFGRHCTVVWSTILSHPIRCCPIANDVVWLYGQHLFVANSHVSFILNIKRIVIRMSKVTKHKTNAMGHHAQSVEGHHAARRHAILGLQRVEAAVHLRRKQTDSDNESDHLVNKTINVLNGCFNQTLHFLHDSVKKQHLFPNCTACCCYRSVCPGAPSPPSNVCVVQFTFFLIQLLVVQI